MPSGKPVPATPEEMAKFGHIATLIRSYMEKHAMKAPAFAQLMGFKDIKHLSQIYKWGNAKAGPGPMYRGKLAKVLGCEPDYLKPHDAEYYRNNHPVTTMPSHTGRPRITDGPVLQFQASADGEARVRLDVTLPVAQAMPLLRILLDAGFLIGSSEVPSE